MWGACGTWGVQRLERCQVASQALFRILLLILRTARSIGDVAPVKLEKPRVKRETGQLSWLRGRTDWKDAEQTWRSREAFQAKLIAD